MNKDLDRRRAMGFSTVELLLVVAIVMLIAMIAVPNITRTIANVRMRASMTSLSGVVQNCRMVAVQQNRTMTTFISEFESGLIGYVKQAGGSTTLASTDPQVQLQAPIVDYEEPSGAGAPTGLTTAILGFTAITGDPSFNSRGLPCEYVSGNCTNKGFLRYFKDTSQTSSWAAISISPAGRIKRWFWNGRAWVD